MEGLVLKNILFKERNYKKIDYPIGCGEFNSEYNKTVSYALTDWIVIKLLLNHH